MRTVVFDDDGKELFSYASPERYPGQLQTMCSGKHKKSVIIDLAECIQVLCDTQFPIE